MTHEYAPIALPEYQEAAVHRREVTIDTGNPFLMPAEKKALETVQQLPDILEAREAHQLERQENFATVIGAEAVNAVIVTASAEKQQLVAERLVVSIVDQNIDSGLVEVQTPDQREALVFEVLERLRSVGHDRIDNHARHAIALRDAQIETLKAHITQLEEHRKVSSEVVDGVIAAFQHDPEVLEELEQVVQPLESVVVDELSDLPKLSRISTAEMELMVSSPSQPELVAPSALEQLPTVQSLRQRLAKKALLNVIGLMMKRPTHASREVESINA